MTPRWKIRRGLLGHEHVWFVYGPDDPGWGVYFRVWENAFTYIELHEAA